MCAYTTLPPRKKPLARQSPAGKRALAEKRKAYRMAPKPTECLACGGHYNLSRSHVLTQKQRPDLAANPANWVTLCWECHCCWENDKGRFARLFPAAFDVKMGIMLRLAPVYFRFFRQKYLHLF